MELLTKKDGKWAINFKPLYQYIDTIDHDKNTVKKVQDYILHNLADNPRFMFDFISRCNNNIIMEYSFYVALKENDTAFIMDFNIDMFIKYYEENQKNLKVWQREIFRVLKHFTSDKYLTKRLSETVKDSNFSYLSIRDYFLMSSAEFKKMIIKNKQIAKELYDLVFNEFKEKDFLESIEKIFRLTEDESFLVEINLATLKYHYEPNIVGNQSFLPKDHINGYYKLSDKLVNEIMGDIPNDFDDLEKAYYIYYRLCEKFYYDEEYYCYSYGTIPEKSKAEPSINHRDINRLNTIDINSGVICNEITMLFVGFLKLLNIRYQVMDYYDNINVRYGTTHIKVRFKVGEYIIDADAGHGLYNSDMSTAKIYQEVYNFEPIQDLPKRVIDKCHEKMDKVDKYIVEKSEDNEFNNALEIYEDLYGEKHLSFAEKVKVLSDMIKKVSTPFIVIFSWVEDLALRIFDGDQKHCHAEFIINNVPTNPNQVYELAVVIIYNEKDTIDHISSNKYLVIKENRQEELLSYSEFKQRMDNGIYDFTSNKRKNKLNFEEGSSENKHNR